jgi:hypothetical protein
MEIADIYKHRLPIGQKSCANICKEAGISGLTVVYSKELPLIKQTPPATMMILPATAGILMAKEAVSFLGELPKRYEDGNKP